MMKSDVVRVDGQSGDFSQALELAAKTAAGAQLNEKNSLQLQIMTEEMLSLVRSVVGGIKADYWIEHEDSAFELHLSTQIAMTQKKREQLIRSATSGQNDAAGSFLGKLRDILEKLVAPSETRQQSEIQGQVLNALASHAVIPKEMFEQLETTGIELPRWDGYEKSILQHVADHVRIGVRGKQVDIIVQKTFHA